MMRGGDFKVVEQESVDGSPRRVLHFDSFEMEPFGYEDLRSNNPRKPLNAAVKLRNATLGNECQNVKMPEERYRSDFVLQSHFSNQSYALVQGGWVPPGFSTLEDITYLLDRCAYNDVRAFCRGQDVDAPERDFVEYLTSSGTRINVLPVLLEGNRQRKPTDFEIIQQYQEVMSNLAPILPHASFTPSGIPAIIAAKNLLNDPFMSITRERSFLADIAPLLQSPVGRKRRDEVLRKITFSADLHSIGRSSFVFLAAVSAAVCPQSESPARKTLKIRSNYGEQDIYNALADLRSLKLLSGLISTLPDQNPAFCTSDKNLALFWVGLQGRHFTHTKDEMSFTVSISEELFPGVDVAIFS